MADAKDAPPAALAASSAPSDDEPQNGAENRAERRHLAIELQLRTLFSYYGHWSDLYNQPLYDAHLKMRDLIALQASDSLLPYAGALGLCDETIAAMCFSDSARTPDRWKYASRFCSTAFKAAHPWYPWTAAHSSPPGLGPCSQPVRWRHATARQLKSADPMDLWKTDVFQSPNASPGVMARLWVHGLLWDPGQVAADLARGQSAPLNQPRKARLLAAGCAERERLKAAETQIALLLPALGRLILEYALAPVSGKQSSTEW